MLDFPAAHSMDTTWFAIDEDGCVGIFDSGEGGAVPENLSSLSYINGAVVEIPEDLLDILLGDRQELFQYDSLIKIEPILEARSIEFGTEVNLLSLELLNEEISYHEKAALQEWSHRCDYSVVDDIILQLSNERAIDDLKSQAKIIIRFADEKILIYVDRCKVEWLKQAVESGLVLAGAPDMSLDSNLSWLGWYEYDCGEQYPDPYKRIYSIEKPILYSDLPPEITEHIRVTRLKNIRFSKTKKIQPIEHMSCHTWGNHQGWIDTNGVEHDRFPEYPDEE